MGWLRVPVGLAAGVLLVGPVVVAVQSRHQPAHPALPPGDAAEFTRDRDAAGSTPSTRPPAVDPLAATCADPALVPARADLHIVKVEQPCTTLSGTVVKVRLGTDGFAVVRVKPDATGVGLPAEVSLRVAVFQPTCPVTGEPVTAAGPKLVCLSTLMNRARPGARVSAKGPLLRERGGTVAVAPVVALTVSPPSTVKP